MQQPWQPKNWDLLAALVPAAAALVVVVEFELEADYLEVAYYIPEEAAYSDRTDVVQEDEWVP